MKTGRRFRGRRLLPASVLALVGLLAAGHSQADALVREACDLSGKGDESPIDRAIYDAPAATLEVAMLFVDFPDAPAAKADERPRRTLGPRLTDWAGEYIDEVSYGQTQLDVRATREWLRMSGPAGSYTPESFESHRAYIQEAVDLAVDSGFDLKGAGTVVVVAAETGGVHTTSAAFAAVPGDGIFVDGVELRTGVTLGDDAHIDDYGDRVLVHELLHTVGLPDLYRYEAARNIHRDVGAWDIMGWVGPGLHTLAWHKLRLGWLAEPDHLCVDGEATRTLTPLAEPGGLKAMIMRVSPHRAYVVEARAPIGKDAGMCDEGGVLIYEVDATAFSGATGGVAPIEVESASGRRGSRSPICENLADAPFGIGPGEVSSFTEGSVAVEVLAGSPEQGYEVRASGPDPDRETRRGEIATKVRHRRGSLFYKVRCPRLEGDCASLTTLEWKTRKRTRLLGFGDHAVDEDTTARVEVEVPLNVRRPLRRALTGRGSVRGVITGSDAEGRFRQRIRIVG